MGRSEHLRILTLNTWGLWLVSRCRWARITQLAKFLSTATHLDIVLLQEVWVDSDAAHLMACASQGALPHAVHHKAGIFGSGLVTLSRFPILESGFSRYAAGGDPGALLCGDYYAAKGVGWCVVDSPLGVLHVFNTHLHANYSHKVAQRVGAAPAAAGMAAAQTVLAAAGFSIPQDAFAPYRLSQLLELAQVVRHVCKAGCDAVVLGGDLNTKPHFLEMALLRALLPDLLDTWQAVHGREDLAGLTCDAPGNTFKSTRQVPERIDYLLVAGLQPSEAEVTLRATPRGMSYSDHLAVQATFQLPARSHSTDAVEAAPARSGTTQQLLQDGRAAAAAGLTHPPGGPGIAHHGSGSRRAGCCIGVGPFSWVWDGRAPAECMPACVIPGAAGQQTGHAASDAAEVGAAGSAAGSTRQQPPYPVQLAAAVMQVAMHALQQGEAACWRRACARLRLAGVLLAMSVASMLLFAFGQQLFSSLEHIRVAATLQPVADLLASITSISAPFLQAGRLSTLCAVAESYFFSPPQRMLAMAALAAASRLIAAVVPLVLVVAACCMALMGGVGDRTQQRVLSVSAAHAARLLRELDANSGAT